MKTKKMRMAIGFGAVGTLFGFIFGLSYGGSPAFALLCGGGLGLFMGIGNYLGIVKSGGGGGGGGGRGGRGGGGGGGFRSGGSSRSSSGGGGGRSGGGGASGRW